MRYDEVQQSDLICELGAEDNILHVLGLPPAGKWRLK